MKPRLLDLFCGAGGCTKGYQRAGFYVVGVDTEPQPDYCGDEARERIFTAADVILRHQRAAPWGEDDGITAEALCEAVGGAMTELGYELRRQEETLLLAANGVGYAVVKA